MPFKLVQDATLSVSYDKLSILGKISMYPNKSGHQGMYPHGFPPQNITTTSFLLM